jgi:hypothetical protein
MIAVQVPPGVKSDPDWIRTNDLQLRRLPLYPTELPDLFTENIPLRGAKVGKINEVS